MKVLIVIDSLGSGGAQRLKIELAKQLSKNGHAVHIFTYNLSDDFFSEEIAEHAITHHKFEKKNNGFSIEVIIKLRRLIAENNFQILISSLRSPSIYSALSVATV